MNQMYPIWKLITRLQEERFSFRFIFSRLLPLLRLNRFFKIKREGYYLNFSPTALSQTLWYKSSERLDDVHLIKSILNTGDIYIDIGCNIGDLALAAYKKVGVGGEVIAIEPHPRTYKYLRSNIKINSANIVALNKAVGDSEGIAYITDKKSDDQNSISSEGGIPVDIVRLDDLFNEKNRIKLIKIDVEGYEYQVILGGIETLKKTEFILFEVWDEHLKKGNNDFKSIYNILTEIGFEVTSPSGKVVNDSSIKFVECVNILARNTEIEKTLYSDM